MNEEDIINQRSAGGTLYVVAVGVNNCSFIIFLAMYLLNTNKKELQGKKKI